MQHDPDRLGVLVSPCSSLPARGFGIVIGIVILVRLSLFLFLSFAVQLGLDLDLAGIILHYINTTSKGCTRPTNRRKNGGEVLWDTCVDSNQLDEEQKKLPFRARYRYDHNHLCFPCLPC
ncbi:hypothetical protein GALMADRAFT_559151 [Galerina marginata CBS 339.88]|uniref:Uncharacterized protein n=1 Tax=Galerina marginata (strain CBS 339.88) TaxID=685588 RepID=A0A067T6J4_GALM3|nr:hypothetical protein GALMADRAFT_559151 [Galerina marginata CBS 339.88]